jgi:hypothetical protein
MDVVGGGLSWNVEYVLGHENGGHGPQEDSITTEESKELFRRREDFPLRYWSGNSS